MSTKKMKQIHQTRPRQLIVMIALLVAVGIIMFFLSKCSHTQPSHFATVYSKSGGDTLDIAIELNPATYSVRGDSIGGRDWQILQEISQRHGVPMKFHPFVPLQHALDGLRDGRYDMVVASMPLTAELREQWAMTEPVFYDRQVLVQQRDSSGAVKISRPMELAGDSIWIAAGSPIRTRLVNLSHEIGDTIHIIESPEYSAEQLFILAATGQIPRAVVAESVAEQLAPLYPAADAGTAVSFTQFQSWALNKDNQELLDSLNKWIDELQ